MQVKMLGETVQGAVQKSIFVLLKSITEVELVKFRGIGPDRLVLLASRNNVAMVKSSGGIEPESAGLSPACNPRNWQYSRPADAIVPLRLLLLKSIK